MNDSLPPSPALSRTFSTYGNPVFQRCHNYLYYGEPIPSLADLYDGVIELGAQMSNGRFHFTDEQMSRWNKMVSLAETYTPSTIDVESTPSSIK